MIEYKRIKRDVRSCSPTVRNIGIIQQKQPLFFSLGKEVFLSLLLNIKQLLSHVQSFNKKNNNHKKIFKRKDVCMTTTQITNFKLPILSRNEIFEQFNHSVFFIKGKVYDMKKGWLLDQLSILKLEHGIQKPFDNHNVVQLTKNTESYKKVLGDNSNLKKIFADYFSVKSYYDIKKTSGTLDLTKGIYQLLQSGIPFTCEGGKKRGTLIFTKDDFMYVLMDKIWISKTFNVTPYNYSTINLNNQLNPEEGFYV